MKDEKDNRPLRIALVLDKFLPSRGGERYFSFLASELARRGHDVHVFATEVEGAKEAPYHIHTIAVARRPRWLRALRLWGWDSASAPGAPFDVVHAVAQCRAATVLNPHGGVEAAWLSQEFASMDNPLYRAYRRLRRYLSVRHYVEIALQKRLYRGGGVKRVIAISKMVKADIVSHYAFPEERVSVVFNTVDLDRFHPRMRERCRAEVRAELGLGRDAILLLFAGNNYRLKGLPTLIRALSLLAKDGGGRDFRLLVAGRGRMARYRGLARRLGVEDRIVSPGPLPAMERYYGAADIYVHPTFYDSCSLTVLEALASGLPAVTTRFNGASDAILSGDGGAVIDDPADARALAEAVMRYADPEARERARVVARSWMERYPAGRNVEETLAVYYDSLRP